MNPIQKKSVDYAKSLGYKPYKMSTDLETGWPDYMFVGYAALIIFVEFKRPGEPLRPRQNRMIKDMAARGHAVFVIDNVDEFKRILSLHKRQALTL
jgi:hypothetical protein